MRLLRVIDFETTGTAPSDEVIEIGIVHLNIDTGEIRRFTDRLFSASKPIPTEVMAVHHIRDQDVAGKPSFIEAGDEVIHGNAWFAANTVAFGAHNAKFESQWLNNELRRDLPLLCSYKCALRKWPDAPKHSNQALRYWLGLDLDPRDCDPPHRALPDAWVTAHIFRELLRHGVTLDQMIEWSSQPAMPSKITFGKHNGTPWYQLDTDYLNWIIEKSDMEPDTKWYARKIIGDRVAYLGSARQTIDAATSYQDLVAWFESEQMNREKLGIFKGKGEYDVLVKFCQNRRSLIESRAADSENRVLQDTETRDAKALSDPR